MWIVKKINKSSGYTPSGKISWLSKLASEFFGTIFLCWMIGILGVTFGGLKFEIILSGGWETGVSRLVIGWWVALDVFLVLAIFSRWSCDLNPVVTTYRIISKQNSLYYGLTKISIQMIGGLIAGLSIWGIQALSGALSNSPADGVISSVKQARTAFSVMPDHIKEFDAAVKNSGLSSEQLIASQSMWVKYLPNYDFTIIKNFRELQPWSAFTTGMDVHNIGSQTFTHSIAVIGELLGSFMLLWPIMSKEIKSALVKDVALLAAIGFGVAAFLEIGAVGWNPARVLATNWIYDALKPGTHAMKIFPSYIIGELLAPFALFYAQKLSLKMNKIWGGWLKLGKVSDLSQHINEARLDKIHDNTIKKRGKDE